MIHNEFTTKLDEAETAAYEDPGELGDNFRRKVKRVVQAEANAAGHPIEIEAFDGVVFEQILPESR